MMRNREIRERIELLEQENQHLARKIIEIEEHIGYKTKPVLTFMTYFRGSREIGYDALRKRYRKHGISFSDGL